MEKVIRTGLLNGSDLDRHIARGEVILQVEDEPDRQVPDVRWHQYGIVPTNEVAVTARCGPMAVFAMAGSSLHSPAMANRIFGNDVLDVELGNELACKLWELFGEELTALAIQQRTESGQK